MSWETQILQLHKKGLINAEIARGLGISSATVAYHLNNNGLTKNQKDPVLAICRTKEKALIQKAARKGLPCDLDGDGKHLYSLLLKQDYKCYVTGITMRLKSIGNTRQNGPDDDVWSVDRVRPDKGYVKSNLVLMAFIQNYYKRRKTLEEVGKWNPMFLKKLQNDKDLNLYD